MACQTTLLSCHTAVANGYAIEGHVPMEDVKRLLEERPPNLAGIAVAGMPLGSPGMEVPDGAKQPFQVDCFRCRRAHERVPGVSELGVIILGEKL